jgi:hypothetical protein
LLNSLFDEREREREEGAVMQYTCFWTHLVLAASLPYADATATSYRSCDLLLLVLSGESSGVASSLSGRRRA